MYRLPLSERETLVHESPIRKLAPYAEQAKREGVQIYHLNIGQPDIETPLSMRTAYRDAPAIIEYGPSAGLPELRDALAAYYQDWNIAVDTDEIFVTNGGSEAIIFSLMALTSPGDEIIIPEPYYANYNGFAAMVGVKIVPVTTTLASGFHLPRIEAFEEKISEKTRAILFSNPGNPTGAVFSRDRLGELCELAKRKGLYLISDEVYREICYDGAVSVPLLTFPGMEEHVITVDSLSKRFSACGARIGSIVTRNERVRGLIMRFAQARLCPPTVDQIAAVMAFESGADYIEKTVEEYRRRREVAYRQISSIEGAFSPKTEGAFYQMIELPIADTEEFALWLLKDFRINGATVMVAPGQGFYATPKIGSNQIRVAYVLNSQKLVKALEILKAGVEEFAAAENLHRHRA